MNGTLVLGYAETAEDLLVKALRILVDEDDGMMDERRQHVAMACQSYRLYNPDGMDRVKKIVTDDFVKNVLIPEICDNIAQQYIHNLVQTHIKGIWEYNHPVRDMPEQVRLTIQSLYADESQTSSESQRKARELETEWSEYTGEYAGQHSDVIRLLAKIYLRRAMFGVRHRPSNYAKNGEVQD